MITTANNINNWKNEEEVADWLSECRKTCLDLLLSAYQTYTLFNQGAVNKDIMREKDKIKWEKFKKHGRYKDFKEEFNLIKRTMEEHDKIMSKKIKKIKKLLKKENNVDRYIG